MPHRNAPGMFWDAKHRLRDFYTPRLPSKTLIMMQMSGLVSPATVPANKDPAGYSSL